MSGVGIIGMIVIGLIAGYVAEKLTESDHGLFTNLVVGLIGAFVGGIIANLIGLPDRVGFLANLVVADPRGDPVSLRLAQNQAVRCQPQS